MRESSNDGSGRGVTDWKTISLRVKLPVYGIVGVAGNKILRSGLVASARAARQLSECLLQAAERKAAGDLLHCLGV